MRNTEKILKPFHERKSDFLYQQIHKNSQCQIAIVYTQHPIDKAGSTNSFNSEDAFAKVSLCAEKLKLFINFSDSKENENNVDAAG